MSAKDLLYTMIDQLTDEEAVSLYEKIDLFFVADTNYKANTAKVADAEIRELRKKANYVCDSEKELYHDYLEKKYESIN